MSGREQLFWTLAVILVAVALLYLIGVRISVTA